MGGHAAWRKRVAKGELAVNAGGAIMRHSPHFNRGKPLPPKKGHGLRGGNNKKLNKRRNRKGGWAAAAESAAEAATAEEPEGVAAAAGLASPSGPPPPYIMDLEPGASTTLPFRYSVWLCLSSLTFLFPVACALVLRTRCSERDEGGAGTATAIAPWPLICTHTATCFASVNYWRWPRRDWRRTMDLVVARVSFLVTVTYGALHVKPPPNNHDEGDNNDDGGAALLLRWLRSIGWLVAAAIPALYALSSSLHNERRSWGWLPAHAAMHGCIAAGMAIAVAGSMASDSPCAAAELRGVLGAAPAGGWWDWRE